jgi:hypothetical protein
MLEKSKNEHETYFMDVHYVYGDSGIIYFK